MKKILLTALLLLSTQVFAKEVRVFSSGTYTVVDKSLIKGNVRKYAKKQALLIAKQNAIEEAGTTLYSSIYIANDGEGRQTSISKLEAISAGVIKTKILRKKFINNKYTVHIEATIDVADVEAVFNRADKRLKSITKLQRQNAKITKQISSLTKKLQKVLAHSTSYKIDEPKKLFKKQEKLVAEYERNINKIKVKFKKGTLADMVNAEDGNAVYDELEELKKEWDNKVTKPFMRNTQISILHLATKKRRRDTAEIDFVLKIQTKDFTPKLSDKLVKTIKGNYNRNDYNYKKIYFKNNPLAKDMSHWINRHRTLAIQVSIGDHKYITESILFTKKGTNHKYVSFNDDALGVQYLNTKKQMTKRKIFEYPIKDLKSVDHISAEVVVIDNNYLTCEIQGKGYPCVHYASVNNFDRRDNKYPIGIGNLSW